MNPNSLRALMAGVCFIAINSAADAGGQQGYAYSQTESSSPAPSAESERVYLTQALDAARSGDVERAKSLRSSISDPVAKKVVTWAIIDANPNGLSFFELDQARRDLEGFPRPARRQAAAERQLDSASLPPSQVLSFFAGKSPETAEGAMALAGAYQASGRDSEARELIRRFWRDEIFEADAQSRMLARFGSYLRTDDHVARADMLLYGTQGPAAQAMLNLLPADKAASARVRMALRAGASNANDLLSVLPPGEASSPGVAFERARYLRKHNLDTIAIGLAGSMPTRVPNADLAGAMWTERRMLVNAAIKAGDYAAAYHAAADSGLPQGPDLAEAEFYAGWIALRRLHNPRLAEQHFAHVGDAGATPITQGRAWYWRGRAEEAAGDPIAAQVDYGRGAQFTTAFYGQLAAEKAGQTTLVLGHDPVATAEDQRRFEARDVVKAIRLLSSIGKDDLARAFIMHLDDNLDSAVDYVQLVDLARADGDQFASMMVVRAGAQRGFILTERGYPTTGASGVTAPDPAFVLGIVRQESSFDPHARSGAGARGMMQLMPGTASGVARRIGVGYSPGMLEDPSWNIRVGSAYLQDLVEDFSGSWAMAAAGYNAGPGRPPQWTALCGDPRGGGADPVDFIECIPFSETRNYVMRVLEAAQVYKARLNGGSAPLTLSADLKRGGYGHSVPHPYTPSVAASQPLPPGSPGTMSPIND